jgi:hypothetical protein
MDVKATMNNLYLDIFYALPVAAVLVTLQYFLIANLLLKTKPLRQKARVNKGQRS